LLERDFFELNLLTLLLRILEYLPPVEVLLKYSLINFVLGPRGDTGGKIPSSKEIKSRLLIYNSQIIKKGFFLE